VKVKKVVPKVKVVSPVLIPSIILHAKPTILMVIPVYNEVRLLPLKLRWCQVNGLPLYVVDNYSKDGTWEWLTEHKDELAGMHRVDTNETFDLRILQKSIMSVVHKRKPDWFVYGSADLFYVTDFLVDELLSLLDSNGYQALSLPVVNLNNTGEKWKIYDPLNTYFYFKDGARVTMTARYHQDMECFGDKIGMPGQKVYAARGALFNFGFTKSVKERNETYQRRQKAWANGMKAGQGKHYPKAAERNWIWKKEELRDIRESEYAHYYDILRRQTSESIDQ
jgi:glycosyltransferase involved in cell wall biosynthesis